MRKPAATAPLAIGAAVLAILLHIFQPAMAVREAAQNVIDAITAESICSLHHADPQGDHTPQALHCKVCHVCCTGHADLAMAAPLPVRKWQSWLPTPFARATPVRGPPVIQARARAPPALS